MAAVPVLCWIRNILYGSGSSLMNFLLADSESDPGLSLIRIRNQDNRELIFGRILWQKWGFCFFIWSLIRIKGLPKRIQRIQTRKASAKKNEKKVSMQTRDLNQKAQKSGKEPDRNPEHVKLWHYGTHELYLPFSILITVPTIKISKKWAVGANLA